MPKPTRGHERGTPVIDGVARVDPDDAGYTAVSPTPMSGADAMPSQTRTIVVTGDLSIDWMLLSSADEGRGAVDFIWMWGGDYTCRALSSSGGAASHAEILRAAAQRRVSRDVLVVGAGGACGGAGFAFPPRLHAHVRDIQQFPRDCRRGGDVAPGASPSSWAPTRHGRRRSPQAARRRRRRHADDRRPRHWASAITLPGCAQLLAKQPRSIVWQTGRTAGAARRSPTPCSTSTPTSSPSSPPPTSCARPASRWAMRCPGSSSRRRSSARSAPIRSRARGASSSSSAPPAP